MSSVEDALCPKGEKETQLGGYYGLASFTNILVAKSSIAAVLESIDAIKSNNVPSAVFVLCDYGTADGRTSMPVICDSLKKIKETYGVEQVIQLVYEDLPENDFRPVFLQLNESDGCLLKYTDVFVSAVGRSFYQQVLPPGSLHLGYSIMSMHWLSKKPCNITDGIYATQIKDESERQLFVEQAAKDWETILLHRAKELKKGGRFVSVQLCVENDGSWSGKTTSETKDVILFMANTLKDMVTSGRVTEEEYHNTNIDSYMRSLDEYTLPFNDELSAVRRAGLKLISVETKLIKCAYAEKWLADPQNSTEHAQAFVDGIRSWSNYSFFSGLSTKRSEKDRWDIVDNIFASMVREVAKDPTKYRMDHIHAHMVIERS